MYSTVTAAAMRSGDSAPSGPWRSEPISNWNHTREMSEQKEKKRKAKQTEGQEDDDPVGIGDG